MVFISVILLSLLGIVCFFAYHAIKYRNPYKLIMVFGKKGSGKSTLETKLALRYARKGRPVFCDRPGVPGTYYFQTKDVGICEFPPGSVIMVDEAGMVWDNRDFKNFKNQTRDYFKLQRHYKNTVYLFSQSFDIDKKLRDLTDRMYLTTSFCNAFSVARAIGKKPDVSNGTTNGTGESKLIETYYFEPLFLFWAGSIKITYLPKYFKYFNSFEAPALKAGKFTYTPLPLSLDKHRRRRKKSPAPMAGDDEDAAPVVGDGDGGDVDGVA